MQRTGRSRFGFTVVEMLIVIVVIGILASITTVAYTGSQANVRDTSRLNDMKIISEALELFYLDNRYFPLIRNSGSTAISQEWSTSADSSWEANNAQAPPYFTSLKAALVPKYIAALPKDPKNTPGIDTRTSTSAYSYAYFGSYNSNYCNRPDGQGYILVFRTESIGVKNTLKGDCPPQTIGPYTNGVSTIRVMD